MVLYVLNEMYEQNAVISQNILNKSVWQRLIGFMKQYLIRVLGDELQFYEKK